MKILVAAALAAALAGCAILPTEDWTARDTALELSFQAMNAADAVTTVRFRALGGEEQAHVTRAIIGPRPSRDQVAVYFATRGLTHYLISRWLPPRWRPYWSPAWTIESGAAVHHNCRIKLRDADGSLHDAGIC